MAQIDSNSSVLVTVGGWFVAIVVALFTFVAQWRKGGVDETAVVLSKWKELVESHERQLATLHQRIADLEGKVKQLEQDKRDIELIADEREERITDLERELAGEKRQREQQARSFAEQLKRLGHNNPPDVGGYDGPQK